MGVIKAWYSQCPKEILDLVGQELDNLEWKYNALSEHSLRHPWLWLGSKVDLQAAMLAPTLDPLVDEQTINIDWSLPLSQAGMVTLWTRIFTDFTRATTNVHIF